MPFDPSKFRARLASEKKWYSINNIVGGEADVMLYGEIGWMGTTAEDFVGDLKQLQANQINLHLSSPGGGVFDGIAIMNALRAHPANVTVYVDSLAASIASVIAMAGDRIIVRQAAEFMIHEASGLVIGNAGDCREMAELLDRQSDKIAGIYAARAGGTVEDWRAAMAKETWYSAQEAVDAGLADEVDEPSRKGEGAPDEMAVAASWDLSVFRYAGREQAPAPGPVAKAEPPKPAPAAAAPAPSVTLTFNVGDAIDEQLLAVLRKAVARRDPAAEAEATVAETAPVEPKPEMRGEHGPELVRFTDAEPEPETSTEPDPWAGMVAHLTQPDPNPWAELVSHLTEPTASSSAATEAA
jgi:ATP-dependent protease ClpP protease subunit